MKIKTLLLSFFITLTAAGQDLTVPQKVGIPIKDAQAYYELVDSAQATQAQLYTAFKAALLDLFKTPAFTVQMDDKEAGMVAGKSNIEFTYKQQMGVESSDRAFFTFSLQAKEGKYRIILRDWRSSKDATALPILELYDKKFLAKHRERYLTGFNEGAQLALLGFNAAIKKQLAQTSDW